MELTTGDEGHLIINSFRDKKECSKTTADFSSRQEVKYIAVQHEELTFEIAITKPP